MSADSVWVAYALDGIVEHGLSPGLPIRSAIRLRHKAVREAPILGVVRSSRLTWVDTHTPEAPGAYWRNGRTDSTPLVFLRQHAFHEYELVDNVLFALGTPGPPEWDEGYDIVLWSSRIGREGPGPFEPVVRERVLEGDFATEVTRRNTYLRVLAGSLRRFDDSSLLLFPGYDATVRRLSLTGALLASWDLSSLGVGGRTADRTLFGEDEVPTFPFYGVGQRRRLAWNQLPVVDDVLSIRGRPAVVVRTTDERGASWRLGILHSKDATWYRIPATSTNPSARLRIDADERGRIAFVVGDRGRLWEDHRERKVEVVVCVSPD